MDIFSLMENSRCYFCGCSDAGRSGLCHDCGNKVIESSRKKGVLCPECSQPLLSSDLKQCPFCHNLALKNRIYSISYFNSQMKELLILYKSGQMPALRFFFASLIYDYLRERSLLDICIVPVPPRKGKIRSQGWDQVDLLCRTLRRVYGLDTERVLERMDHLQQKTLNFDERKKHMNHVLRFRAGPGKIRNYKSILLLDDILTSGATISAAEEIIRQEYDGNLSSLVICSVL